MVGRLSDSFSQNRRMAPWAFALIFLLLARILTLFLSFFFFFETVLKRVPKELISRFVKICPTCQVRRGGLRLTSPTSRRGSPGFDQMFRTPKAFSPPSSRHEAVLVGRVSLESPQMNYMAQVRSHAARVPWVHCRVLCLLHWILWMAACQYQRNSTIIRSTFPYMGIRVFEPFSFYMAMVEIMIPFLCVQNLECCSSSSLMAHRGRPWGKCLMIMVVGFQGKWTAPFLFGW